MHCFLRWWHSKTSDFQPVHDFFQNSWLTGVSYSSPLSYQYDPLTPCSIICMMSGGGLPFKHAVEHWQSWCQEEPYFSTNYFQSSSNSFIHCQYLFFSGSVAGLRSFISLTLKPYGSILSLPWCLLPGVPGRAIFPGCSIGHFFNILTCSDWAKATVWTVSCLICTKACHCSGSVVKLFSSQITSRRGLTIWL